MRRLTVLTAACVLFVSVDAHAQQVEIAGPTVFLRDVRFAVTLSSPDALTPVTATVRLGDGTVVVDTVIPPLTDVVINDVVVAGSAQSPIEVVTPSATASLDRPVLAGWISILPPLVAITMALLLREVVASLVAGIWLGALFLSGHNPITALFRTGGEIARGELTDPGNASIVIFSLLLGGMVGVVTRMGGTRAIVEIAIPLATTRIRGQIATWLAGLGVFFDDYSNSLIVGNTMRPLTDRLRISREKLAYIVDSTAAPVAAVFFVSTWIGYQVGLIDNGLDLAAAQHATNPALAAELSNASGFGVFLQSIPYLFYPLLAIFMVVTIAATGRDFGPMLRAERRAASGGGLSRPGAQLAAEMGEDLTEADNVPAGRWWNGAIPVGVLVSVVLYGLIRTGLDTLGAGDGRSLAEILGTSNRLTILREIFGASDPFTPLIWGALLACVVSVALATFQRIISLREAMDAWLGGLRAMLLAMVILVLAWSLGGVTEMLNTAGYLSQILSGALAPALLPTLVFIVAGIIAFSTGTSWATMAILLPLVVPLSVTMMGGIDFSGGAERAIVLGAIGSVLAGAILGDHCSPISDTTVLSSTASSCDHVDHVRTQLPYALLVGGVSIVLGSIPAALGVPAWICLIAGAATLWAAVRLLGQPVEGGASAIAGASELQPVDGG